VIACDVSTESLLVGEKMENIVEKIRQVRLGSAGLVGTTDALVRVRESLACHWRDDRVRRIGQFTLAAFQLRLSAPVRRERA